MKPYSLAVKAVIVDEAGRCLMVRRSPVNRHFVGCWEWPGGKVDPGEAFDVAVLREVREETGLAAEITGFAGATSFEMPKVNVTLICMEARVVGGAITLSKEHDAIEWVPLADLANWALAGHVREFMLEYAARKVPPGCGATTS